METIEITREQLDRLVALMKAADEAYMMGRQTLQELIEEMDKTSKKFIDDLK